MRECRTSGSVRGVLSNGHPYRNRARSLPRRKVAFCALRSIASRRIKGLRGGDSKMLRNLTRRTRQTVWRQCPGGKRQTAELAADRDTAGGGGASGDGTLGAGAARSERLERARGWSKRSCRAGNPSSSPPPVSPNSLASSLCCSAQSISWRSMSPSSIASDNRF
jgi:hypothetical protein